MKSEDRWGRKDTRKQKKEKFTLIGILEQWIVLYDLSHMVQHICHLYVLHKMEVEVHHLEKPWDQKDL